MCYLVAKYRLQETKPDDESSISERVIPNDATLKALKSVGDTFNFIDTWLYNFRDKYFDRSESYRLSMDEMFKTITQNVEKPITSRQKNLELITDIGGGWYLENFEKEQPLLKRTKLSQKAQERDDLIENKKNQSNRWWNDW